MSVDAARTPRLGLVFPGQGAPRDMTMGVLHRSSGDPLVRQLLRRLDVRHVDELRLKLTAHCQPATFAASVLGARSFALPDATMGHSLGELAAIVVAGGLPQEQGLELAYRRGQLSRSHESRPGGMLAVMGVPEARLETLRRIVVGCGAGTLDLAAVNSPRQMVVSGEHGALRALAKAVAIEGGSTQLLDIEDAFHSPLMVESRQRFAAVLEQFDLRDPLVPIVSPTDLGIHRTGKSLAQALADAFVAPVRWHQACGVLASLVDDAVDVGPGRTLRRLARFSDVLTYSTAEPASR